MAFNRRMTKATALMQAIFGLLCTAFGTVDVLLVKSMDTFVGMPIWLGAWVLFTGSLGIILTANKFPVRKQWLMGSFLGFSLASCAVSVFVAYLYIPLVVSYAQHGSERASRTKVSIAVSCVVAVLVVAEACVGIWSAVCCSRGCYFCGGSLEDMGAVGGHDTYLGMATHDAMASGSHVLVEVPGAPPAVVPVQVVDDLDHSHVPLADSEVLY